MKKQPDTYEEEITTFPPTDDWEDIFYNEDDEGEENE